MDPDPTSPEDYAADREERDRLDRLAYISLSEVARLLSITRREAEAAERSALAKIRSNPSPAARRLLADIAMQAFRSSH